MKALTLANRLNIYLQWASPQFRVHLPKCISNSETQIKNGVAYKKSVPSCEVHPFASWLEGRNKIETKDHTVYAVALKTD